MSQLDNALALAALGFHVFPLGQRSKLPDIDGWQRRATRDQQQIERWWTCPVTGIPQERNVGIMTGRYGEDQALVVVDVDNKGGKHGDDTVLQLELEGYDLPSTRTTATPTGGWHLFYVVDEPVRQGVNVLGPAIDIRSHGGFVVAPGSVVEAGEYTTAADVEPVAAPQWLVDKCGREVEKIATPADAPQVELDLDHNVRRAIEYLEGSAPEAQEGAGGNAATFAVAARVKDLGISQQRCVDLMLDNWNDSKAFPPWPADELEVIVGHAYRYGRNAPGSATPEAAFGVVPEPIVEEHSPELGHPFDELNKEYAFVLTGGGHHILWETTDEHGQFKLEHLDEATFHKMHAARKLRLDSEKMQPLTKAWIEDKRRRTYNGIVFMPGKQAPEKYYNLWNGFAVEPLAKKRKPSERAKAAVDAWFEHIALNICCGESELADWLISYFAQLIQAPDQKPLTALVLRGPKGVGKNAPVDRVGRLLGSHYLLASNRRYLVGNFNSHMESLLMFVLDEAFWSGDKAAEGQLKDLITGQDHLIEHKGKEPYRVDNKTRIVIIGNEDWLVPATHDERRFAVFDVGTSRQKDRQFFINMRTGMEANGEEGYRLLLRRLLDYKIQQDINGAPDTEGLLDQKTASLEPEYQWWLDCLTEGVIQGSEFTDQWPDTVPTERMRAAYHRYAKGRNIRARMPESRAFGRLLKRIAPNVHKKRDAVGYVYKMPDLDTARADWERFIGHKVDWS